MNTPLLKVLAAGPGVVLGGSFESLLIGGQPTLVTRDLWVDNFSAGRVLLHYVALGWSGDTDVPTLEEWPYLTLVGGKRHTVLNGEIYFDFALRAREQHGEPFGLLLRRAVGVTLTVKVVTAHGPAFLISSLWVPKQERPEYFLLSQQNGQ
ncbi:hypothetical protein [Deinococcus sp.]|uniref:hypothetical protein n=1 Tax=Deinococcus sp. TaxID=47478 RepID=UPI003C7DDE22